MVYQTARAFKLMLLFLLLMSSLADGNDNAGSGREDGHDRAIRRVRKDRSGQAQRKKRLGKSKDMARRRVEKGKRALEVHHVEPVEIVVTSFSQSREADREEEIHPAGDVQYETLNSVEGEAEMPATKDNEENDDSEVESESYSESLKNEDHGEKEDENGKEHPHEGEGEGQNDVKEETDVQAENKKDDDEAAANEDEPVSEQNDNGHVEDGQNDGNVSNNDHVEHDDGVENDASLDNAGDGEGNQVVSDNEVKTDNPVDNEDLEIDNQAERESEGENHVENGNEIENENEGESHTEKENEGENHVEKENEGENHVENENEIENEGESHVEKENEGKNENEIENENEGESHLENENERENEGENHVENENEIENENEGENEKHGENEVGNENQGEGGNPVGNEDQVDVGNLERGDVDQNAHQFESDNQVENVGDVENDNQVSNEKDTDIPVENEESPETPHPAETDAVLPSESQSKHPINEVTGTHRESSQSNNIHQNALNTDDTTHQTPHDEKQVHKSLHTHTDHSLNEELPLIPLTPENAVVNSDNCSGPNTKLTKNGQCVCAKGFHGDTPITKRGCWKCKTRCNVDATCAFPGECVCNDGLVGDGVTFCRIPKPVMKSVSPSEAEPTSVVTISYSVPTKYKPHTGYCMFGSSITAASIVDEHILTCEVPVDCHGIQPLRISLDSLRWSDEQFNFKIIRNTSLVMDLPWPIIGFVAFCVLIIALFGFGGRQQEDVPADNPLVGNYSKGRSGIHSSGKRSEQARKRVVTPA